MLVRVSLFIALLAGLVWLVPFDALADAGGDERRARAVPASTRLPAGLFPPRRLPPATVPEHERRAKEATLPEHCTLSKGFWKNHPLLWPAPYAPDRPFFSSGLTWYETLWTPPRGENAYFVLAHQYMAAQLNLARGVEAPTEVPHALAEAEAWLAGAMPYPARHDPVALELAATLERFNDGEIGPGACP